MKEHRISIKIDDRLYKMLEEIVKEETTNGKADLHFGTYGITTAIKQGIIYAHSIIVSKEFEMIPNRELLEERKKHQEKSSNQSKQKDNNGAVTLALRH